MLQAGINSEFGKLKTVLIHEPGAEVENMTPETAERALYSDILNLPIARQEYEEFKGVLKKVAHVIEIKDLLKETIQKPAAKRDIIEVLISHSGIPQLQDEFNQMNNDELVSALIEGVPLPQISLANFLHNDKFAINPLHNMFFMRDASFTIGKNVYVSSMARSIRKPESKMLEVLYKYALNEEHNVVYINDEESKNITIEGGDVLVASPEVLLVGIGSRTSPEAVDRLIKKVSANQPLKYVLVQELPHKPESFIHLDMVFTLLNDHECMVYKPVMLDETHFHSILMKIDNGEIKEINYIRDFIDGLKICGMDYKPIFCGGGDKLLQEREQWHSGANFFAFAPGKVMGYARNIHTAEALNKAGFEVVTAEDVVSGLVPVEKYDKCLVTIESSELARGGGGARCMTMPLLRE
jgi:arginine deiminase